ncbi:hypothetical protein PVA45_07950 (plasmid) [Entomospira entomophila]|uniref:Uncharacterized protein n=1 Tax=Entomospira entomophila TaxID=2719988 RepID=A0A968GBE2_9SPIO|nr:hypothetical protein [Entomospira entomophilus]NIZ41437.1 hypothetical protein [Entomospira entomophilus]WDI36387.1 hypothetical protein PVA45_07950 [Entomospira entomophilus]
MQIRLTLSDPSCIFLQNGVSISMLEPYYVLTSIYDASGWIEEYQPSAYQLRQRYYQPTQHWLHRSTKTNAKREMWHLLHQQYQIHDFNALDRYIQTVLCDWAVTESIHAGALAFYTTARDLRGYTIDTIHNPLIHFQHEGYLQLTSFYISQENRSRLQNSIKQEHHRLQSHSRLIQDLYTFFQQHASLWEEPQLQINHKGIYVAFSGYYFVHLAELLALADQLSLAPANYIHYMLEKLSVIMHEHFDDWQMFWASYIFGLFYVTQKKKNLSYQESLAMLDGVLFHNLYTLLYSQYSPFTLEDHWSKHSLYHLTQILRSYSMEVNRAGLHPASNFNAKLTGTLQPRLHPRQEDILQILQYRTRHYHQELFKELQNKHLHQFFFWTLHPNDVHSLYSISRLGLYASSDFWRLTMEYDLFARPAEIPLWVSADGVLFSSYGFYLINALWPYQTVFIEWHPRLKFRVRIAESHRLVSVYYRKSRIMHWHLRRPCKDVTETLYLVEQFMQACNQKLHYQHAVVCELLS